MNTLKPKIKKLTSTLLAVILALGAFTIVPITANAETSGDYEYITISASGSSSGGLFDVKISITDYFGSATELEIPSEINGCTVVGIGDAAFDSCYSLTSVTIPGTVTSIGGAAFQNCYNLTSITIPDSVTSIAEAAFNCCESLTNITVDSKNLNYISDEDILFNKAKTELIKYPSQKAGESYIIPDSVTTIGWGAFSFCANLTNITIPDSVTDLGDSTFSGCYNLTNITIPDSVTRIGEFAFSGCYNLTSITIPESVTDFEWEPFAGCSQLTIYGYSGSAAETYANEKGIHFISLDDPDNNRSFVYKVLNNGTAEITGYYGEETEIVIPSEIDGYTVTGIREKTFSDSANITSITIPDSVTYIGYDAFFNCASLASITIPDSVTEIGNGAFSNTAWYSNQPDGVVYAGKVAYIYKGEMPENTSIDLKDGTKVIGESAFRYCEGLESIVIPDSVTSIGLRAFFDCANLASVTIPDSVTKIEYGAFDGTAWYDNQPDGVVYAGKVAYRYKGEMPENTSIELKNDTKGIASSAFRDCISLTDITIPDSVTSIGDYAFDSCSELESITIPDSVTSIGENAFGYYFDENYDLIKADDFTVHGYTGTAAETYANENGFAFIAMDDFDYPIDPEPLKLYGDVNGDGILDVNDVTYIQMYLAQYKSCPIDESDSAQFAIADFNEDGIIDISDATAIQMGLAGYGGRMLVTYIPQGSTAFGSSTSITSTEDSTPSWG